jgi:hypothetical protein
MAISEYGET